MKSPFLWKSLCLILAVGFAAAGFSWVMQPRRLSMQAIPLPLPRYVASTAVKERAQLPTEKTKKKTMRKAKPLKK